MGNEEWKDLAKVVLVVVGSRKKDGRVAVCRTGRRSCLVEDIDAGQKVGGRVSGWSERGPRFYINNNLVLS